MISLNVEITPETYRLLQEYLQTHAPTIDQSAAIDAFLIGGLRERMEQIVVNNK
jgi:hypothetical protein